MWINGLMWLQISSAITPRAFGVRSGHVLLVDETGDKCINLIQFSSMVKIRQDSERNFIKGELSKTSWMVSGVCIHEIELDGGNMYSACIKDTSTDTLIYVATPNETQTAEMINSIALK